VKRFASLLFGALLASTIAIAQQNPPAENFTITVLHTNDLHAHVEPVTVRGKSIGGYARQASILIDRREKTINPLILNAGDVFQGTLYFNEYEGLADLSFMNLIGYQAMAVGNHEFDRGVQPLITFANLARFPVIATNLDVSKLPDLAQAIKKSAVIEVAGQKIGIVASVPDNLLEMILPVPGVAVLDYQKSIQAEVDSLTKQGINKIILLSHGGFDLDTAMAPKFRHIDLVVGGHSHTLLGTLNIPDIADSRGEYPTVSKDANGNPTLIVQAWEWGKVVGEIEVTFDPKGIAQSWRGNPILVDDTWPENPYVATMLAAFKKPIEAMMKKPVAELKTDLAQRMTPGVEPTMGYVIADAALSKTAKLGAQIAFWNSGGVRAPITAGTVTYGQLAEVCPFGNQLVVLTLTGQELLGAIQHGVNRGGMLLPSRGFVYTIEGDKLISATFNGNPIDPTKSYKVTFSNFTSGGGDGHEILKNAKGQRIETGFVDLEALIEYFEQNNPLTFSDSRIKTAR
jgi:5'-nucleotidase / UDP-sugar diphosphatase